MNLHQHYYVNIRSGRENVLLTEHITQKHIVLYRILGQSITMTGICQSTLVFPVGSI